MSEDLDFEEKLNSILNQRMQTQMQEDQDFMNYGLMKARTNLFFDDNAMIEYIASEKFPDDPMASYRFKKQDGVLVYEDYDGQLKKVFEPGEDVGWLENYFVPNIVPATTFVADLSGGMAGAAAGYKKGVDWTKNIKNPIVKTIGILGTTAIGGFGGNFLLGGVARTGREAMIDMFYNLPPEEIAAAYNDLLVSSAFSAIPFGAGPTRNVINKFTGKEDGLRYLMNLRTNNDEIIKEASQMGIQLTPAEAADIATRAVNLQYFLSRQPQIEAVRKFYNNRSARIREATELFADSMGAAAQKYGDIGRRISEAAASASKQIAAKRKERATKLYNTIRNAEEPVSVDTSAIIKDIDDKLANPELGNDMREALEAMKDQLFDANGNQISNLMSLHDRRAGDIENLIQANRGTSQQIELIRYREGLTDLFEAHPVFGDTYRLAKRVYDPTKPQLELIENSAIGRLSKVVTDKQKANAIKELFNPDVSVQSMRNVKRVLQAVDPEAMKDVKKMFVKMKLDDFTKQSLEGGMPQFQQYFARPKTKKLMQEFLSPDEFQKFDRMIEIMGKAYNTVPRGGSPTQPLLSIEKQLADDTAGLGLNTLKFLLGAVRLSGRLIQGTIGDDLMNTIAMKQADAYYDALSKVLFDPDSAVDVERAYQYFSKLEFGAKQAMARGAVEGVEAITEEDQKYNPTNQQLQQQQQELQKSLNNPQGALDVDMFEDLPMQPDRMGVPLGIDPATSPTILPRDEDRELAMRLRSRQQGIAGLV